MEKPPARLVVLASPTQLPRSQHNEGDTVHGGFGSHLIEHHKNWEQATAIQLRSNRNRIRDAVAYPLKSVRKHHADGGWNRS